MKKRYFIGFLVFVMLITLTSCAFLPSKKNTNDHKKYYWLIYDSKCPYCKTATESIKKLDWEKKFRFISYHDPKTYEMFPFLVKEECAEDPHLVTPEGDVLVGYEVFRRVIDTLSATKMLNPLLKNDLAEKKLEGIYKKMVEARKCHYDKEGECTVNKKENKR